MLFQILLTIRIPLFFLLILSQWGCATITGHKQFVRVATPSPQSKVFYEGDFLGVGSQSIKIKRGKGPQIEIEDEGVKKEIKLETSYRWGQSFGGNALLFSMAPYGWLIDILTGAAWEVEGTKVLNKDDFKISKSSRIIILPPQSENSFQSYKRGQEIEAWLDNEYHETEILPFVENYKKMIGQGFDYDSVEEKGNLNDFSELLYKTKASHIVFSKFNKETQKIELKILSPYTEDYVAIHYMNDLPEEKKISTGQWLIKETFSLLPNTLSIGSVDTRYSTCARRTDFPTYCASSGNKNALSFFSSLNLTNILHYRKRKPWHFYIRFYPDLTFSINDIRFEKSLASLPDIDLDWYFLGIGYGVRLSFIIPIGELFFESNPFWAANYLRLYSDNTESTYWGGRLGFATQMGFNTWLSNQWNMRLFVKFQNQGITVPGISTIDPGSDFNGNLTIIQSGLSVGYYFLEEKVKLFDAVLK